ncbi:MAG: hypothetical protein PHZ02_16475 [Desulfocapsaceae bacterium]|nr:hypothetical protein [Desulfocapsaceae bacterium]
MIFDPNTWLGSISGQVVAGILTTALLFVCGIAAWPLRWWRNSRKLQKLLLSGRKLTFVFNSEAGKTKIVTFLPDGKIGEGSNENEYSWRIKHGQLEIFASDGSLYSRFKLDGKTGRLCHTNDTDTKSILGQYFVP